MWEWLVDVLLTVVGAAVLLVAVVVLGGRRTDRWHQDLRVMAQTLGLHFEATHMGSAEGAAPPADQQALAQSALGAFALKWLARLPMSRGWSVTGERLGVAVSIAPERIGKSSRQTALYAHFPQALGWQLEVAPRSMFNVMARAQGAQELASGDTTLDAAVSIRCAPAVSAAVAARLARPEVRAQLLALFKECPAASVNDLGLRATRAGAVTDAAILGPLLDQMARTAALLQPASHPFKRPGTPA